MEKEEAGGRKEMGVENPSFVGDKEELGNGKLNGTVQDSGSGGLEAVNLELVNMNPYAVKDGDVDGEKGKDGNGYIAADDVVRPKKGTDDLDPEHPDDEYFVSSPSRKKGIRSFWLQGNVIATLNLIQIELYFHCNMVFGRMENCRFQA